MGAGASTGSRPRPHIPTQSEWLSPQLPVDPPLSKIDLSQYPDAVTFARKFRLDLKRLQACLHHFGAIQASHADPTGERRLTEDQMAFANTRLRMASDDILGLLEATQTFYIKPGDKLMIPIPRGIREGLRPRLLAEALSFKGHGAFGTVYGSKSAVLKVPLLSHVPKQRLPMLRVMLSLHTLREALKTFIAHRLRPKLVPDVLSVGWFEGEIQVYDGAKYGDRLPSAPGAWDIVPFRVLAFAMERVPGSPLALKSMLGNSETQIMKRIVAAARLLQAADALTEAGIRHNDAHSGNVVLEGKQSLIPDDVKYKTRTREERIRTFRLISREFGKPHVVDFGLSCVPMQPAKDSGARVFMLGPNDRDLITKAERACAGYRRSYKTILRYAPQALTKNFWRQELTRVGRGQTVHDVFDEEIRKPLQNAIQSLSRGEIPSDLLLGEREAAGGGGSSSATGQAQMTEETASLGSDATAATAPFVDHDATTEEIGQDATAETVPFRGDTTTAETGLVDKKSANTNTLGQAEMMDDE